ncbi:hypothetical protein F4779DRAFT_17940 [Xylariaceae sp. FL0662B]|nr:hypothetical protein F4779DRAFT_17940 [Xylariaceae sp. FL0662B]
MNAFLLLLVAATAHISLSLAQVTSITTEEPEPTTTAASSSAAVTHTVRVGLQHDFQPDTIQANPGDTIHFNFYPKNHSVVRAAFENPCIPWELTQSDGQGFFSGAIEQETPQNPLPSWDLLVNHTDPVFFYCSAPGSCINYSMVGVINPNDTFTLDIQKDYVKNSTFQLSPGEAFPDEAPPSSTTSSAPPPSATSSTPSPSATSSAPASSGHSTLSGGGIAGIVIGGTAVVVAAIALVYFCGRKGGIEKGYRRSGFASAAAPPQMIEANYGDASTDGPKSPPMPSPYTASSDPYRSSSPTAWSSQVGSPHVSAYMGPHNVSPGFPPYAQQPPGPAHEQQQQQQQAFFEAPDSQRRGDPPAAAVELPGSPPAHPPPHS